MNSLRQITAPALFPFFLIVGMMGILCLPSWGQEPSAVQLSARYRALEDKANELFPSPYDRFGPARRYQYTDGVTLQYHLFEPERVNETIYPLVLFLHGSGGAGTDNLGQFKDLIVPPTVWAFPENQAKYPCYVLVPQGSDRPSWPHAKIPSPKYTWYPDAKHNSWEGAYSDSLLLDWVFSQRKK